LRGFTHKNLEKISENQLNLRYLRAVFGRLQKRNHSGQGEEDKHG
jgi:hypothetical protein